MIDNEIVRTLRSLAVSRDNKCDNPTVMMLGKELVLNAAADLIESLRGQIAASQARERAAVKDIERLMHRRVPLYHACQFCTRDDRICRVKGHVWECKPKWRGPQTGEGENK